MKTAERSVNLCTYYLLPLIGLNKLTFGRPENFVNCYLDNEGKYLVVALNDFPVNLEQHPNYKFDFENEEGVMAVFEIPAKYHPTVVKFRDGKYSHFSDEVKSIIKKKSGLRWNVPIEGGKTVSAKELLALDKDRVLKEKLERDLRVRIDDDAELISAPTDRFMNEFYDLGFYHAQHSH